MSRNDKLTFIKKGDKMNPNTMQKTFAIFNSKKREK